MTLDSSSDSSSSYDGKLSNSSSSGSRGRGGLNSTAKITTNPILIRPNASSGYWLCCLLPAALIATEWGARTTYSNKCHALAAHTMTSQMLIIAALGMCIESLCFFLYMFVETGLLLKLVISLLPGLTTSLLYVWLLQKSLGFALFCGFAVTFCYQNVYIRVMRGLPHSFTYGEACIMVQGCMLFLVSCILQLPQLLLGNMQLTDVDEFAQLKAIMMSGLLCLLLFCCLLGIFKRMRQIYCFYLLLCLLLVAVTLMPITKPLPIIKIAQFILSDKERIYIILFCLLLVVASIAAIVWQLQRRTVNATQKASTRMRKIFHLLIVLLYVPGMLYQCHFLYIASGVALAIFTILELVRILDVPPLNGALKRAFEAFSDDKDSGALALTPFCLLIGISMPLWLSVCPCVNLTKRNSVAVAAQLVPLMAGVLSIGIGDTAASVIGSKFGQLKWKNSSRTLEGTIAYIISVSLAVYVLYFFDLISMSNTKWLIIGVAIFVTALVEAHINQIDNLVLPLIFYTIVSWA